MSFSPDGRWLAAAAPAADRENWRLRLYRFRDGQELDAGVSFPGPKRRALRPSWSRDGSRIALDSVSGNAPRIVVADVSRYTMRV